MKTNLINIFNYNEEKTFKGITLGKNNYIKVEGHRMTVNTFLRKYGKDGVWSLLPYYDLDEEILKEYHIHKRTPEEKTEMEKDGDQKCTVISTSEDKVYETTVSAFENGSYNRTNEEEKTNNSGGSFILFPSESICCDYSYGYVPVGTFKRAFF